MAASGKPTVSIVNPIGKLPALCPTYYSMLIMPYRLTGIERSRNASNQCPQVSLRRDTQGCTVTLSFPAKGTSSKPGRGKKHLGSASIYFCFYVWSFQSQDLYSPYVLVFLNYPFSLAVKLGQRNIFYDFF